MSIWTMRIALPSIKSPGMCDRPIASQAMPPTISLEDSDGVALSYAYDATARTLTRAKSGVSRILLKQCDRLNFSIGQRNAVGGSYDVYPAATPATCKVVNVSWICSRTIFGIKNNTESVQTARIVIRKQGT